MPMYVRAFISRCYHYCSFAWKGGLRKPTGRTLSLFEMQKIYSQITLPTPAQCALSDENKNQWGCLILPKYTWPVIASMEDVTSHAALWCRCRRCRSVQVHPQPGHFLSPDSEISPCDRKDAIQSVKRLLAELWDTVEEWTSSVKHTSHHMTAVCFSPPWLPFYHYHHHHYSPLIISWNEMIKEGWLLSHSVFKGGMIATLWQTSFHFNVLRPSGREEDAQWWMTEFSHRISVLTHK